MISSVTGKEKAHLAKLIPMEIQNGNPILQVRHLSIIFPDGNSGLKALDDISFSVNAEQFVCVLGPSGCGKTTLLRLLAGLLSPTSGEVIFGNSSLTTPRPGVGMVFQKANLMPWRTVLENILLPLEIQHLPHQAAMEKAQALVELVGLTGFEDCSPARPLWGNGSTGGDRQGFDP